MFAELYILYLFEESTSVPLIPEAFLDTYGSLDVQDAYDPMMYRGVHLIIWPCRTKWSKSPKLMECIGYGCDILEKAREGNFEWFKQGIFGKLFFLRSSSKLQSWLLSLDVFTLGKRT